MYTRFLQIIINDTLHGLATIGDTLILQDPNVYKRIKNVNAGSQFNTQIEFDIFPSLLNDQIEIMEVPASPKPEVEDSEKSDEDETSDSYSDDGNNRGGDD